MHSTVLRKPKYSEKVTCCVIFLSFLTILFYNIYSNYNYCWDDAYMYVRYVNNILTGNGYTWNAGEKPVFGCTSITYTFFILCIKIVLPSLKATTILITASTLFSIASLLVLFIILKTVLSDISISWIVIILAILGLQPLFFCHSLSGMDASCAFFLNALNMLFVYKAYASQKVSSVIKAGISSYLAYLTRVDSAFLAFVFPVILFFINTSSRKIILSFVVTGAMLVVVDLVVKYSYFQDVLPLPFYSKRQGHFVEYIGSFMWNPLYFLKEILIFISPLLLILISFFKKRNLRQLPLFLPILISIALTFDFVQIMGACGRFYYPMVPQFVLVAALIFKESFIAILNLKFLTVKLLLSISILLTSIFVIEKLAEKWDVWITFKEKKEAFNLPVNPELKKMDWWEAIIAVNILCKKLPENKLLAATEHGYIAASNPSVKIMDLIGLHDPVIAKSGNSGDYLAVRKPSLIWMIHTDYTGYYHYFVNGRSFKENYYFIPGAFLYGVAVLKDDLEVQEILKKELIKYYPNIVLEF